MKHLDFWSRLGSLALAVVALCIYQAHALQWQAAEEENKQQLAEVQAQNAAAEGGAVSYVDGTYTGSGDGFGGTVSVSVTVSGGKITAIDITDAANEDAAYLDKAKGIVESIISANSPEVDTISGATFSSTGIKTAVQEALKDAVDTSAPAGGATSYADGTYIGSGEGFGGTVSVSVTVSGGKITAIDITDAANEDAAYLDKAKGIIGSMIAANSPEVDTISGATFSSTGIKTAVEQALEDAA